MTSEWANLQVMRVRRQGVCMKTGFQVMKHLTLHHVSCMFTLCLGMAGRLETSSSALNGLVVGNYLTPTHTHTPTHTPLHTVAMQLSASLDPCGLLMEALRRRAGLICGQASPLGPDDLYRTFPQCLTPSG